MNNQFNRVRDAEGIEERLRRTSPPAGAPNGLHDDIMLAVRAASVRREEHSPLLRMRLIPALAFAGMLVFAVVWLNRPAHNSQALTAPAIALRQGELLAQNAPANALSPLNDELESLKRDLNGAVAFVIASVP